MAHPARILQRVHTARHTVARRRHGGDERRGGGRAHEAVAEHTRQLGLAEGRVRARLVHAADALLQRQQTLVDLGALLPVVAPVVLRVDAALAARQVDEGHAHRLGRRIRSQTRVDLGVGEGSLVQSDLLVMTGDA